METTGSTVLALTLLGKVSGQDVTVTVPGGELRVTIDRDGGAVKGWMPAEGFAQLAEIVHGQPAQTGVRDDGVGQAGGA